MDDEEIVKLFLERNEKAIEETSIKYGSKLNRIAMNILKNEEDAQECENDTYHAAWNLIPPNEPRTYFFTFLAKIIRNLSLNYCKSKKTKKRNAIIVELTREMQECIEIPNESPCHMSDSEIGSIISIFLRKQKEENRKIFIRRYWYADSIKQISDDFKISESKVKSILFRTRNKLKNYIKKEGYRL